VVTEAGADPTGTDVAEPWHLVQTVEVMVTAMVEVVEPVSMLVTPPVVWVRVTGQMVVDCETMTVVMLSPPDGAGTETDPIGTEVETPGVETTPEVAEEAGVVAGPDEAGTDEPGALLPGAEEPGTLEAGTVGAVVGWDSVTGQIVVETAIVKVVRAVE
jgi:hypothetical protein